MIKRVLLGIGGTPFTKVAIRRAIELCQMHEAQLTAVTVIDERRLRNVGSVPLGASGVAQEWREQRIEEACKQVEECIEELKSLSEEAGVHVNILREEGQPFQLMIEHARYHDISVFGLRSMFEYDILHGTGTKPAKILDRMTSHGVKPIIASSDSFKPIRKALIAYGGSIRAASSMHLFMQMKLWPDMEIRLVDCASDEGEAHRNLSDAKAYVRTHGYEPDVVHRQGNPTKEILAEAHEWEADIIVLGTSCESFITKTIFGSTARHVIQKSDCPLFIGK